MLAVLYVVARAGNSRRSSLGNTGWSATLTVSSTRGMAQRLRYRRSKDPPYNQHTLPFTWMTISSHRFATSSCRINMLKSTWLSVIFTYPGRGQLFLQCNKKSTCTIASKTARCKIYQFLPILIIAKYRWRWCYRDDFAWFSLSSDNGPVS